MVTSGKNPNVDISGNMILRLEISCPLASPLHIMSWSAIRRFIQFNIRFPFVSPKAQKMSPDKHLGLVLDKTQAQDRYDFQNLAMSFRPVLSFVNI